MLLPLLLGVVSLMTGFLVASLAAPHPRLLRVGRTIVPSGFSIVYIVIRNERVGRWPVTRQAFDRRRPLASFAPSSGGLLNIPIIHTLSEPVGFGLIDVTGEPLDPGEETYIPLVSKKAGQLQAFVLDMATVVDPSNPKHWLSEGDYRATIQIGKSFTTTVIVRNRMMEMMGLEIAVVPDATS